LSTSCDVTLRRSLERRDLLLQEQQEDLGVDPEDAEAYAAKAILHLPEKARASPCKGLQIAAERNHL